MLYYQNKAKQFCITKIYKNIQNARLKFRIFACKFYVLIKKQRQLLDGIQFPSDLKVNGATVASALRGTKTIYC